MKVAHLVRRTFTRGIMGPFTGIRPLTKAEIELCCDGDLNAKIFREQVIIKNGVPTILIAKNSLSWK